RARAGSAPPCGGLGRQCCSGEPVRSVRTRSSERRAARGAKPRGATSSLGGPVRCKGAGEGALEHSASASRMPRRSGLVNPRSAGPNGVAPAGPGGAEPKTCSLHRQPERPSGPKRGEEVSESSTKRVGEEGRGRGGGGTGATHGTP